MKSKHMFTILLWWSVIGYSLWIGGTLFSMVVVVPLWSYSPPESVTTFFTGTNFNNTIFNFFGPPWMALRSLPLFIALGLSWNRSKKQRNHLIAASVCMLMIIVFTIIYVYPINDILMRQAGGGKSASEIRKMTSDWVNADRLRYFVGCIGYLFLLRAFHLDGRVE